MEVQKLLQVQEAAPPEQWQPVKGEKERFMLVEW